jgi:hypothetical protein
MSKQTLCDRCGVIVPEFPQEDGERIADVRLHVYRCEKVPDQKPTVIPRKAEYDWCDACLASFEEWRDEPKKRHTGAMQQQIEGQSV